MVLFQGTYNSTITIESNDPGSPFQLPVVLNLTGTAVMGLSDSCVDLGASILNDTVSNTLEIYNRGCDTINISNVVSTNGAFVVDNVFFL